MSSSLNRMQMDDFCAWNGTANKGGYIDKWKENTAYSITQQVMQQSRCIFQTDRCNATSVHHATKTTKMHGGVCGWVVKHLLLLMGRTAFYTTALLNLKNANRAD